MERNCVALAMKHRDSDIVRFLNVDRFFVKYQEQADGLWQGRVICAQEKETFSKKHHKNDKIYPPGLWYHQLRFSEGQYRYLYQSAWFKP